MPNFRIDTPKRTFGKKLKHYRSYKRYLIADFSNRCGYCDGGDTWTGGYRSYHIDHFAPKDKFSHLENDYSNLVYACPSCNLAKSNKWPSTDPTISVIDNDGFLDPCNNELNDYFSRDDEGNIQGHGDLAKNIIRSLNLGLERHAVIWKLTSLEHLITEYEDVIESYIGVEIETLQKIHYSLLQVFFEYHKKLRVLNS